MTEPAVFLFLALHGEAQPLIRHWRLKKSVDIHPYPIYSNHDIVLVISGIGNIAMAGAVAYTLSKFSKAQSPILLNIGIAGHRLADLGRCFLADKIVNTCTGRKFYPQFPFRHGYATAAVLSLPKPQTDYIDASLYDMEAAGFYEIASRFSSSELTHSLKIVSDNGQTSLADINADLVGDWLAAQLPGIGLLIEQLKACRRQLVGDDDGQYRQLLAQYHFTASGAVKLKSLLQKRLLLCPELAIEINSQKNAKQLLSWLEQQLEEQAFYL